jgi:hypothetical protein
VPWNSDDHGRTCPPLLARVLPPIHHVQRGKHPFVVVCQSTCEGVITRQELSSPLTLEPFPSLTEGVSAHPPAVSSTTIGTHNGTFSARLPAPNCSHVLTLPDFDRVGAIQTYWGNPDTRTFGELLIGCEEDRTLRAVLVGMLREGYR